ncbi:S-adenosyl-L-methionine-dependent methyltransferase [Nadsonia fulvescens var. elongata DSM 6958]|uniref:Protein-lysine N-methyltransferase EFM4 n=1 Tax=Nadsonia fulvescens var. elongata DSM 6958 TaxID=857566 RepID=A0A1E3PRY5_9ASCO|nr:S-adenosyl-L-methionine-dependent methyltransferase [Nadsonia fulvescens var. elongata DSM 6958]
MSEVEDLNISKLGTQKYWDDFYDKELQNFEHNPQDTGECWFADSDAEDRVIMFLQDNAEDQELSTLSMENSTMVDLGTGNGHLLFSVREAGFEGKLTGLDYSLPAVEFSKKIALEQDVENVEFEHADFLSDRAEWMKGERQWDIVLDKGTLDAIALSDIQYELKNGEYKSGARLYGDVVQHLIKKNGLLLITSCNFTQEELIKLIVRPGLSVWKTIDYPSFEFAGVQGQTICSVAFIKAN